MNRFQYGLTFIESLVAMAVLSIVVTMAFPISAAFSERKDLSLTHDRFSQALEKSIAAAISNEHEVEPATALCRTEGNELTILQASATEVPNCSLGTGATVWSTALPANIDIQSNGESVQCQCFNPDGFLTSDSCPTCTTQLPIEFSVLDR